LAEPFGRRQRNLAKPAQQQGSGLDSEEWVRVAVLESLAEPLGGQRRECRGVGAPRSPWISREQAGLHRPEAGDRETLRAPQQQPGFRLAILPAAAGAGVE